MPCKQAEILATSRAFVSDYTLLMYNYEATLYAVVGLHTLHLHDAIFICKHSDNLLSKQLTIILSDNQ
jgi:hypothetical protein